MNRWLVGLISLLLFANISALCNAAPAVVTKIRIGDGSGTRGDLFVTLKGKEKKIAGNVEKAHIILNGKRVAFDQFIKTAPGDRKIDAFKIFEAATGKIRTVIAIFDEGEDSLRELKLASGKVLLDVVRTALSGSPHLYIVDPLRGVVYHPKEAARVIARQGDRITIGFFHEGDAPPEHKPYKTVKLDLKALLTRSVISL